MRRGEGKKICHRNFSFGLVFHFKVFTFVAVISRAEVLVMQKLVVKNMFEIGGDCSACQELGASMSLNKRAWGVGWMDCLADSSPLLTLQGSQTQLRVGRNLLHGNNANEKHETG